MTDFAIGFKGRKRLSLSGFNRAFDCQHDTNIGQPFCQAGLGPLPAQDTIREIRGHSGKLIDSRKVYPFHQTVPTHDQPVRRLEAKPGIDLKAAHCARHLAPALSNVDVALT
ncbi:hypothetical protein [Paracoccus fistulariae]|uniref:Uncharacterized protein n=1 Tax=Paracoccus fistulariae TaxID=658446 RepID=A0ABY7SP38_9RHOB|nr:hypothetical protein [Paracoccus fistulariae]MDB6182248.1 hypothetical protein [Paracoccus fistulariae]WCR08765.1 hypothetical protein JHX87_08215 [Paracoccus fistulariae]